MKEKKTPIGWYTTKSGKHIPIFEQDDKQAQIKRNEEEAMELNEPKPFKKDAEVFRQNKERWAYGKTSAGDLWVGYLDNDFNTTYMKDTPENRKHLEGFWEANSNAREILKKNKKNSGK